MRISSRRLPMSSSRSARAVTTANYYPDTDPPVRGLLAELHGVSTDHILLGAGAAEVIDATIRAFVRHGDEAILAAAPTWPVYRKRLVAVEAAIREVPLQLRGNGYCFDMGLLVPAISPHTGLVIVCSPNNPTGNLMSRVHLRMIAECSCPVLVDSAYDDFALRRRQS